MSPDSSLDNTLTSSTIAHSLVPKLEDRGTNWPTFKLRLETNISARGLQCFFLGTARIPKIPVKPEGQSSTLTEEQEKYEDEYELHIQKDNIVRQQIMVCISNTLLTRLHALNKTNTAHDMWNELSKMFEH